MQVVAVVDRTGLLPVLAVLVEVVLEDSARLVLLVLPIPEVAEAEEVALMSAATAVQES
jgi:hypothetical protein